MANIIGMAINGQVFKAGKDGKPFTIYKTYSSINAMNDDIDNVPNGSYVIISSNVEDEDNAKLYVKEETGLTFIVDLSGAQGIKGDKGDDGAQGSEGEQGVGISSVIQTTTSTADAGDNIITVTLTNGDEFTFSVKNGSKGSQASVVNNLTSTSTTSALAAKQGKVLNDKITTLSNSTLLGEYTDWTPELCDSDGTGITVTYSSRVGKCCKIKVSETLYINFIYCSIYAHITNVDSSSVKVRIKGIPSKPLYETSFNFNYFYGGIDSASPMPFGRFKNITNEFYGIEAFSGKNRGLGLETWKTGQFQMYGSGFYFSNT